MYFSIATSVINLTYIVKENMINFYAMKTIEKIQCFGTIKIPKKKEDIKKLLINANTFSGLALLHDQICITTNDSNEKPPSMELLEIEELLQVNK